MAEAGILPTSTGEPVLSPIVAGAWRMADWTWSASERLAWIEGCVEMGVTSFDHADIYGGYGVERLFGDAPRLQPSLEKMLFLRCHM